MWLSVVSSPASTAAILLWAQLLTPLSSADFAWFGEVGGKSQAGQPVAYDQIIESEPTEIRDKKSGSHSKAGG